MQNRRKTRLVLSVSIKVCTGKVSRERSHAPALDTITRGVQNYALFVMLTLYMKKKGASQPVILIKRIVFVNPEGHRLSAGDFPRAMNRWSEFLCLDWLSRLSLMFRI
jgi:hypothetical protein